MGVHWWDEFLLNTDESRRLKGVNIELHFRVQYRAYYRLYFIVLRHYHKRAVLVGFTAIPGMPQRQVAAVPPFESAGRALHAQLLSIRWSSL